MDERWTITSHPAVWAVALLPGAWAFGMPMHWWDWLIASVGWLGILTSIKKRNVEHG